MNIPYELLLAFMKSPRRQCNFESNRVSLFMKISDTNSSLTQVEDEPQLSGDEAPRIMLGSDSSGIEVGFSLAYM